MRLYGIKAAACALVLGLVTSSTASASWGWPGYYDAGGWYGAYWPYHGYYATSYYGTYPWYTGAYYSYPAYYSYSYPYYSGYYYPGTSYTYQPNYVAPETVVAAPTGREYQSFYPASGILNAPLHDEATVVVHTVPGAELWFDGVLTAQSGSIRTFETPELKPGKGYTYEVRVRWMLNGSPVERTRTVAVAAGQTVNVDLTPAKLLK